MPSYWIFSPSQIDTFLTCKRKWGYIYLDKIKKPPSPAALLGKKVHEVLENYLTKKKIDFKSKEAIIAEPGLAFLPKDIAKENIEKHFAFAYEGAIFQGYIDFFKKTDENTWLIGDHKTCSSLSASLKPEDLKKNTQALIYALWFFEEKQAKEVKLQWVYYKTKSTPKSKIVEAKIKKEELPKLFEPQLQASKGIMALMEKNIKTKDLPKNTSACFKYGRCQFFDMCKNNQQTKENTISLKEKKESFHLFLDCAPTKSDSPYQNTVELSELLKPVLKKIKQEKNIAHYRLMGYGQHVGVMAHYLEEFLMENILDHHTAVLSSSKTPEGLDTLQTLSAAASKVVRGF